MNVFKVCDQPHPTVVREIVALSSKGECTKPVDMLLKLYNSGYSCSDIIGTVFKVTKNIALPEELKLSFLREIGFAHMRIAEGSSTFLQLCGLVGRLSKIGREASEGDAMQVA